MKTVKGMLASLVVFILGLEIGGFGMWYLCMSILNESRSRKEHHDSVYHMQIGRTNS